jgi:hypothetical protein
MNEYACSLTQETLFSTVTLATETLHHMCATCMLFCLILLLMLVQMKMLYSVDANYVLYKIPACV